MVPNNVNDGQLLDERDDRHIPDTDDNLVPSGDLDTLRRTAYIQPMLTPTLLIHYSTIRCRSQAENVKKSSLGWFAADPPENNMLETYLLVRFDHRIIDCRHDLHRLTHFLV